MLIHRNLARASHPSSPRKRRPIRRSLSSKQFGPIPPIQVVFFNQPNLPVAIPFLELLFACNCLIRSLKPFRMNKPVHSVFLREGIGRTRRCSARRRDKSFVTPMYRVPCRPLARMYTKYSAINERAGGCGSPPSRGRRYQLLFPACDFSLIPISVAVGVIASGSILRWRIDGLPEARAAANAAGKSALFSTSAP